MLTDRVKVVLDTEIQGKCDLFSLQYSHNLPRCMGSVVAELQDLVGLNEFIYADWCVTVLADSGLWGSPPIAIHTS
jgi:hypothetical protein